MYCVGKYNIRIFRTICPQMKGITHKYIMWKQAFEIHSCTHTGNRPATISNFSLVICSAFTLNAGDCNNITTDVILSPYIYILLYNSSHNRQKPSRKTHFDYIIHFYPFSHIFVKYTLLRNLGNDVMMFVKLKLFGK